ncbi:MAG: hypothetical protein AAFO81_02520 [Pseudomonadota bacterium]
MNPANRNALRSLQAVPSTRNPLRIALAIGDDARSRTLVTALQSTLAQCDARVAHESLPGSESCGLSVALPREDAGNMGALYRFRALAPLCKAHAHSMDLTIAADESGHTLSEPNARISSVSPSEQTIDLACRYALQRGRQGVSLVTHVEMSDGTRAFMQRMTSEFSVRYPALTLNTLDADDALYAMFKDAGSLDVLVSSPAIAQTLCAAAVNLANAADTATVMRVRDQQCDVLPWRSTRAGDTPASLSAWIACVTECLLMLGRSRQALALDNAWLATLEHGAQCGGVHLISPYTSTLNAEAFADAVCLRLGERPQKVAQRLSPAQPAQPQRLALVAMRH